jgi:hypothetical protein
MDAYKPQFDAYWTPDGVLPEAKVSDSKPVSTLSPSMEVAMEELVERVHAARCIV